jgi:phosphoglucosamine mutase
MVPERADLIERGEKERGEEGRVLVRYSGTQNMCRVMVEGPSETETEKYCREIADKVKSVLG